MNSLTFLNAPLLWGLALASVPIIIHLLFRRRFRRVDWAPMYYLKLSIQRNRRRIRLEQFLLLALRCLIVLLMFFLLARPVMHAAGLGSWLSSGSRTSQLLVLDDSLSMGFQDGGRTAFARGQELAGQLVDNVGPQDRFTLLLASRPDDPVFREAEVTDVDAVRQQINDARPADSFVAWKPVLERVEALLSSGTFPIREVTLITDLRAAGWSEDVAEAGARLSTAGVKLRIFDVGTDASDDLVLVDLRPLDRVALAGAPMRFEAAIRNQTSREIDGAEASLIVDDKPNLLRLPRIERGATVQVPLTATFQEPGRHHVALKLPGDDLPADDQRYYVVHVAEQLRVLLVDGEPSSEPLAGEVDFLGLALSLGVGEADAFRIDVVTDAEWETAMASAPDLLVLANVATLTSRQATELERRVNDGMGLMLFVGDQVDTGNYNDLLYRGGEGLLPVPLELPLDEAVNGLTVEPGMSGPLDALLQLNPAVLARVRMNKFYQVQPVERAGVRVLARWNNAAGSPAVIEKAVGAGRVLLWTITADKSWGDWPTEPSYVLAVREAATGVARSDARSQAITAGETLRFALPSGEVAAGATVESPAAGAPRPAAVETKPSPTGDAALRRETIAVADTHRAGLYKLAWKDAKQQSHDELFAINPDVRESELERIPTDRLQSLWGGLAPEVISAVATGDVPVALRGQEIWRTLAMGMLGLLLTEACFATWVGRQR